MLLFLLEFIGSETYSQNDELCQCLFSCFKLHSLPQLICMTTCIFLETEVYISLS